MSKHKHKPRSEQAELLEDARDVSIRAQVEKLRVIHRLKAEAAQDGGSSEPCEEEPTGDKLTAVGDLAFDLARFQIAAHDKLLKLSARHTDRVLDDLRRVFRRRRSGPIVHPVVHLSAQIGHANDHFKFEVENRFKVPIYVSLSFAEFQRIPDGKPVSHVEAEFVADPPVQGPDGDRYLLPHHRRAFRFKFTPRPRHFEEGKEYRTSIYVSRDGCVLEELPLRVRVTGPRTAEAEE